MSVPRWKVNSFRFITDNFSRRRSENEGSKLRTNPRAIQAEEERPILERPDEFFEDRFERNSGRRRRRGEEERERYVCRVARGELLTSTLSQERGLSSPDSIESDIRESAHVSSITATS